MRGRLLNWPAVGRAVGFAFVAAAIVAAALHFGARSARVAPRPADISTTPDPFAKELKRCQLIADHAKDDPACEAAWAENRRRFFTYAPASTPTPAAPKSVGR